jgi:hypothetical protein
MTEQRKEHKWRTQEGVIPSYKAFHEVYVTKNLGAHRSEEIVTFISKHISEFNGHTEDKHGIPLMLFERKQDAQTFANEPNARLDIPKEHITVKARKYTR